MKIKKPVAIVLGEPNSIFIEILSKVLNKKKLYYPIILIGSKELILSQLKILKKKLIFKQVDKNYLKYTKLKNKIYLIDIKYNFKKAFDQVSSKSKKYISKSFQTAFQLVNLNISKIIINGPISKKHFLENKYPGVTEYVFYNSKRKVSDKPGMLIFNKKLSVSPITTHIPLKDVNKKINKNLIINNITTINNFYRKELNIIPKIAVLGINPHCETKSKQNEELSIIKPSIKKLQKRKINVSGPYSADTFFLKKNISKYNSIIGMYHDQVLTPFKTLFGFDASNITLGLPFVRLSVDHGPNESMLGKNKSNPKSLENIFELINLIV